MLINLIPHMTYFITTLLLMALYVLTKVNVMKLGDFCMWLTWSNRASQAGQFDTPHDLPYHYFPPHGGVRAHHDQLFQVGELVHVTNLTVLLTLINLIPHMTFFIPALLLMAVSVITKVKFLKLENFFVWSILPVVLFMLIFLMPHKT